MAKNTDLDKLNKIQRLYDLECEKTAELQKQLAELLVELEKLVDAAIILHRKNQR